VPCKRGRARRFSRSTSARLRPELWQTQQLQRVGFPLGEEIINFSVALTARSLGRLRAGSRPSAVMPG
jgi:hypothetical protein